MKDNFLKIIVNHVFTGGRTEPHNLDTAAEDCERFHKKEMRRTLEKLALCHSMALVDETIREELAKLD